MEKTSFKSKNIISSSKILKLLHIDLFELVSTISVNDKKIWISHI